VLSPSDEVRADLEASKGLSDYEAVEVLWVALVKAANRMPGPGEHRRMLELVSRMPGVGIRDLLHPKLSMHLSR
jgi:hypothetical protein